TLPSRLLSFLYSKSTSCETSGYDQTSNVLFPSDSPLFLISFSFQLSSCLKPRFNRRGLSANPPSISRFSVNGLSLNSELYFVKVRFPNTCKYFSWTSSQFLPNIFRHS